MGGGSSNSNSNSGGTYNYSSGASSLGPAVGNWNTGGQSVGVGTVGGRGPTEGQVTSFSPNPNYKGSIQAISGANGPISVAPPPTSVYAPAARAAAPTAAITTPYLEAIKKVLPIQDYQAVMKKFGVVAPAADDVQAPPSIMSFLGSLLAKNQNPMTDGAPDDNDYGARNPYGYTNTMNNYNVQRGSMGRFTSSFPMGNPNQVQSQTSPGGLGKDQSRI